MPLLPHLIDLGKELAYFTTTVARVVPPWPHSSFEQEQQGGGIDGVVKKSVKESKRSSLQGQRPRKHENLAGDTLDGESDDSLRKIGRACWDLIESIQERVQLSVEVEQEERRQAAQAVAAQAAAVANGGRNGGVSGAAGVQRYPRGKATREGSRDGEESYVVYEHYENHDMEAESFDGYTRSCDSDDEQRSAHDLI